MNNMKKDTASSTMLVISTGFLVLHLVLSWTWAVYVSLAIGIIGIVSSYLSSKIEWVWAKLSKLLGYIVPNILLGIVYYLFLFPISIVSRIFTKDPLMLSNKYDSYFVDVKNKVTRSSFEKTW